MEAAVINCFIPYEGKQQTSYTLKELKRSPMVNKIYLLTATPESVTVEGCEVVSIDLLSTTRTIQKIAAKSDTEFTLIYTKSTTLDLGLFALERMVRIARDSSAGMVYADHFLVVDKKILPTPVIDYQKGSLRDDFNFGSVLLYNSSHLREAVGGMDDEYEYAGLYDLRLRVSRIADLVHINEFLYTEIQRDIRKNGEKQFDYVDPRNRSVQIEMEEVCTKHLKAIGAYLSPVFKQIEFNSDQFEYEASVIIPVRNRVRTLEDAIKSVLIQETNFKFNLIIIDNHSTDGTSEIINKYAAIDDRIIYIIPERKDLGIGGCWNVGANHSKCGKFCVQLDSDDIYKDKNSLQIMVDAFYEQNCAMVVGTYMMTDFNMNMIAPGIIDHREWTPDNGRNNALRINGLGAPRAFYTPFLRKIKAPNTSYGEDYALGLSFSREYQIGRVYEVVYLCRRWEDNSDASLDVVKMNTYNTYKDRIRTWEMQARISHNKNQWSL